MCLVGSIWNCFIFLRVIIEFTINNRVFPLVRFAAVMPGRNKKIYQRIGSRQLFHVIISFYVTYFIYIILNQQVFFFKYCFNCIILVSIIRMTHNSLFDVWILYLKQRVWFVIELLCLYWKYRWPFPCKTTCGQRIIVGLY